MQSKAWVVIGLFLEVLCLLGGVAFFMGQHNEHLNQLQLKLETIEKSVLASEKAIAGLREVEKGVADARIATDEKLQEAVRLDGALRYEFYDRLLREDACRRAGSSGTETSGGASVPVQ